LSQDRPAIPRPGRNTLEHAMRHFWKDEKGSLMALFALSLLPVMGLMGAAVDYSRAQLARTKMQAALDATGLFLSKLPAGYTPDQLAEKATPFFFANYTQTEVLGVQLAVVPAAQPGKLNLTASGTYNPMIVSVVGVTAFPVIAKTEVQWGNSRLRVALVLDVTGSMSSAGKIDALKTAAKNLIDQLKNVSTVAGDVYISIVPFSKDVAVAPSNYNSNWVKFDWLEPDGTKPTNSWDARNGACACVGTSVCSQYTNRNSCEGVHLFRCSKPQYNNQTQCQNHGGTWSSTPIYPFTGVWTPNAHSTWNGCIMDRDKDPTAVANYDTKNTAPNSLDPMTLFPAEQYSSCPATIMALSYDWTALKQKIDALSPAGNTNQGVGLAWGWQSLTNAPFTIPPYEPNKVYKKILILMSDGLNTQNRFTTSQSQIDAREAITCTNVKADGITIYAVQVNTDGDPTSTVLQNCASDASKFYMLTNANQLITTFDQIGTELANLHLSQ
jgi:Flp pilus assembly protein TadG